MAQTTFPPKLQRLALANVCLGQFLSALDSGSVIVALPTISVYFDSSLAVVQWIPLAYQLTAIGLVLTLARLGDMIGRKRLYGFGFLLLIVGSASSGLSAGLWQLIAFRIVAGIGGATVMGNGRAIVSTVYAAEGRGPALGMSSMAFHLGYIIGPSLTVPKRAADVKFGGLEILPLPSGKTARLTVQPLRRADAGLGAGRSGVIPVTGGALGVVIDARGRPLGLPSDPVRRRELMKRWSYAVGG